MNTHSNLLQGFIQNKSEVPQKLVQLTHSNFYNLILLLLVKRSAEKKFSLLINSQKPQLYKI